MPATFLKSAVDPADFPRSNRPQIAMLGRSNVGKSSLINHLAGVKGGLARTGSKPGLTQTVNFYAFDNGRYLLVDLPGYGFHRIKRSGGEGFDKIIGDYLSEAEQLKLVLLIIDGRLGLTESDRYALEQLAAGKIPFVVVFNKIDKLSRSAAISALRLLQSEHPEVRFLTHSVDTSQGLNEIRAAIRQAVQN